MLTLSSASLFISSCSLLRMCRLGLFFLAYCCSSITLLSEVSWGAQCLRLRTALAQHQLSHPQPVQRTLCSPCCPHCPILSGEKATTSCFQRTKAPWLSLLLPRYSEAGHGLRKSYQPGTHYAQSALPEGALARRPSAPAPELCACPRLSVQDQNVLTPSTSQDNCCPTDASPHLPSKSPMLGCACAGPLALQLKEGSHPQAKAGSLPQS